MDLSTYSGKTELTEAHGTVELDTENLTLRKYKQEDAADLHQDFGRDPVMFEFSGWNPYATPEMAQQTVRQYIDSYKDKRFYGWAVDWEGFLAGTVGAYDYDPEENSIEIGISIKRSFWGHGFATETLSAVLKYLTENEGIKTVKAWCAAENSGSKKAMEKAGMKYVKTGTDELQVGDQIYDKLYYEYRKDTQPDT